MDFALAQQLALADEEAEESGDESSHSNEGRNVREGEHAEDAARDREEGKLVESQSIDGDSDSSKRRCKNSVARSENALSSNGRSLDK